jgi:hypothetical protein
VAVLAAGGEIRVIPPHRLSADNHRIAAGAKLKHTGAGLLATHPSGVPLRREGKMNAVRTSGERIKSYD